MQKGLDKITKRIYDTEIIEIMDRRRKVEFPFTTDEGDDLRISGYLVDSSYETYFDFREAFLEDDPTAFVDEEDLSESDLEKLAAAAEDFLENDDLYRD